MRLTPSYSVWGLSVCKSLSKSLACSSPAVHCLENFKRKSESRRQDTLQNYIIKCTRWVCQLGKRLYVFKKVRFQSPS